jgi:hypothetical protein
MADVQYEAGHVIKLDFPVTRGNEEPHKELTLERRLKAKDFKGIHAQNIRFDDMLKLISRMTGQAVSLIEELDASDMMKCVEIVNSFLPSGQTDGENY